jgi:hypothetical protein
MDDTFTVFKFDPLSRKLVQSKPRDVSIPYNAYDSNESPIIFERPKSTSPFLIALMVVFILILIFLLIYLTWLIFIKKSTDTPLTFFKWLTGQS